jgi:hypothetical protein
MLLAVLTEANVWLSTSINHPKTTAKMSSFCLYFLMNRGCHQQTHTHTFYYIGFYHTGDNIWCWYCMHVATRVSESTAVAAVAASFMATHCSLNSSVSVDATVCFGWDIITCGNKNKGSKMCW